MTFPTISIEEDIQEVSVREMSPGDLEQIAHVYPQVDLGDVDVSAKLNSVIDAVRRSPGQRVFLLKWKGRSRVPAGVAVAGRMIRWTQHGFVRTRNSDTVGTYDRLVDCGGPNGDEQVMLVYISPTAL